MLNIKTNQYIPGWMIKNDLILLGHVATLVQPGKPLVEIGSFLGRSSWTFSKNLPEKSKLHCIDLWEASGRYHPDNPKLFSLANGGKEEIEQSIKIAKAAGDWLTVFRHHTIDCDNIETFRISSDECEIDPRASAIFIDGDHSFRQVNKDITKFDFDKEILLFGHDFNGKSFPGVVDAVLSNQHRNKRILIRPPNSVVWFLWPTTGYYSDKLSLLQQGINAIYAAN